MEKHVLLKSQKNDVFELLVQRELDPARFEWQEAASSHNDNMVVSRLVDRVDAGTYFHFDFIRGEHWCEYAPGQEKPIERQYPGAWSGTLAYVSNWAINVKRELDAPDRWQEIERYRVALMPAASDEARNEPFAPYEADQIEAAIRDLNRTLREKYELDDSRWDFVESRLDYLARAVRHQGRFVWVHTAIGVLVTIATVVSPTDVVAFWETVKSMVGHYVWLLTD